MLSASAAADTVVVSMSRLAAMPLKMVRRRLLPACIEWSITVAGVSVGISSYLIWDVLPSLLGVVGILLIIVTGLLINLNRSSADIKQ